MKYLTFSILSILFCFSIATNGQYVSYGRNTNAISNTLPFNPELKPFYHGVASGDPLFDRVVIWTRVTPEEDEPIEVSWSMATDPEFRSIVKTGRFTTNKERDYTVKIDVDGLAPETTYYYYFSIPGANSLIGRTRTTPLDTSEQLRFAVVSCSNYQAGYFNAYKKIAERKDLDAVIHLGDYIYEYAAGPGTYGYDASRADRTNQPETEILSLVDYRTRYSLYRLDPDLLAAHQQHPFIAIWDDHESANDAYKDGAENHGEEGKDEGNWEDRKAISKQVYFEWMPIRDEPNLKINRTLKYGNLADIIAIDTRLEGRDQQIADVTNPQLYATDRTLLGAQQKTWLLDALKNSTAKWKVITNQVIFSEFNVGWAAQSPQTPEQLESIFLDIWDGYPAERDQLMDFISSNDIDNTIILTGDFHSTFAFDVSKRPSAFSPGAPESITYNPTTGEGSIAVEFATPSVTSANFDENIGAQATAGIEFQINKPFPNTTVNPNPHMKYVDLDQHGYFILDLTTQKAQADWFFVDILEKNDDESAGGNWFTIDAQNRLQEAPSPSTEKANAPALAPAEVPDFTLNTHDFDIPSIAVFGIYPNPVATELKNITVQFGLKERSALLSISIVDIHGKVIKAISDQSITAGIHRQTFALTTIPSGMYFVKFTTNKSNTLKKILVP